MTHRIPSIDKKEPDIKALAEEMFEAAKDAAGDSWEEIREDVEKEFAVLTTNIVAINNMRAEGILADKQAAILWEMQKKAAEAWRQSLKGQALIGAENAINAAMSVIWSFLERILGWTFLV